MKYDIKNYIASGCYSKIYHAECDTQKYVIKISNNHEYTRLTFDDFTKESNNVKTLTGCGYTSDYIDHFHMEFNNKEYYYLILEDLSEWITLESFINKVIFDNEYKNKYYTHEFLQKLIKNLLVGLLKIHSLGIAHKDIKPSNIMINESNINIKYIDFGFSINENDGSFICNKLTPIYAPPERYLSGHITNFTTGKKNDIWSLGIVLYELLNIQEYPNNLPFDIFYYGKQERSLDDVISKIKHGWHRLCNCPLNDIDHFNVNFLVTKMLNKNSDKRPSLEELILLI